MKSLFFGLVVVGLGLGLGSPAKAQAVESTAIVSAQSNQCWDVKDYSTADGAIVQMYTCTGTTNQLWAFQVYGYNGDSPLAHIVNVNSGMCAAAESSNPASGAIGIIQRVCNNNDPTQQWQVNAPIIQRSITTGNTTNIFYSVINLRAITNVASHWCVRTEDPSSFWRPTLANGCTNLSNDLHSGYRLSGAR
ncbi:MAG TPA: RICIN domain-containing protein [Luteibacter sp.]|jgi:hypothetical protein|uniref:RICIN domain-containing protein n=1 Tax=Luteibacter sp. TaxID=1886636 RepID=UPI002F3FFED6